MCEYNTPSDNVKVSEKHNKNCGHDDIHIHDVMREVVMFVYSQDACN